MNVEARHILEQALHLPPDERAAVAEGILFSLDKHDPAIDALWADEVEARIDAYERGEITTIAAEEVLAKYRKR